MTPLEYAEASARTDTLTGRDALASYALGLCGRSAEACDLRIVLNVLKHATKLGDCWWYLFALARHTVGVEEVLFWIKLGPDEQQAFGFSFHQSPLVSHACIVAEQINKRVYHDADNLPAIRAALHEYTIWLISSTSSIAEFSTFADILGANIDKLLARYPEGFVAGGGEP
jgi:hypothetical protein